MNDTIERTAFSTSRAAEFLEKRALQAQTGQSAGNFGDVIVKELVDNGLDAAESAGRVPSIEVTVTPDGSTNLLTVTDNGSGMPADVVERILDFNRLVSDKAAYRSPTRGLQGNAFKTIIGIPYALGVTAPVVIEAHGVRHEIAVSIDPGGNVVVRHDQTSSTRTTGTAVTVPLPVSVIDVIDAADWMEKFAAVNPHANLRHLEDSDDPQSAVFYNATVQDDWRKPVPADRLQIHWYDTTAFTRLVYAHIGAARSGGRDLPLGEFIRSFDGLTSNIKAKTIRAAVPGVETLTDFDTQPEKVAVLLNAMQAEAKAPKPTKLGHVPEDHYRQWIDRAFGLERFWFKRTRLIDDTGLPWVLEVAVAETTKQGHTVYATNYSPSFGDPLGSVRLKTDDMQTVGAAAFLTQCGAAPRYDNSRRAAVVHVITPGAEFTDKGKVALAVPAEVALAVAETLGAATKTLYREHRQAERDALKAHDRAARAAKSAQRQHGAQPKITLKDAVFAVLPEAIAEASNDGTLPFPTRNLYYVVRQRIQATVDAPLKMEYFSQTLVVQYERDHGRIRGHYRDPRGELFEPHTGNSVRLGTREVADYILPRYLFDKILYIEKEGFNPIFEAARTADRYDMAIASGKGQPVEAIRDLFARADAGPGSYKLFVVHDADHHGYTIARAMAEATARMPGYSVNVIDLGLNVAEAVRRGLPTERYTRRAELPWWMPDRLDEIETEWFAGREVGHKQWECTRVELNALGAAGLLGLIETGLEQHGATAKVIPPQDVIQLQGHAELATQLGGLVSGVVDELVGREELIRTLIADLQGATGITSDSVAERLTRHPLRSWRAAVAGGVADHLDMRRDDLRERVRDLVLDTLTGRS